MPDAHVEHPRLVAVYDAVEGGRADLGACAELAEEVRARSVVDVGCGTGVLALQLAERGLEVVGVDPARGSLELARRKPGAQRVRWVHGDASVLDAQHPPIRADLVTMTGNVALAITDPDRWAGTLSTVRRRLAPGGVLAMETRDPAARARERWTRAATEVTLDVEGVGGLTTWVEVTSADGPLVALTTTSVFAADGAVLTSGSVLRFRGREEVTADLARCGLAVQEVRQAPDRPGLEMVFLAT